ncbi:Secretory lipase [compost metagenome]|uniref:Lipase n=1 Tax=Cupriavidus necator TaxID=106590 RepID=A0A367PMM6_CUPNE|nr:lipase family protein [Cupriavidus necator]QQX89181.1 alpha/beta hydrolase [Cupriavidus necator]RCJ08447.1 lipase [Cupriavidus necator]
MSQEESIGVSYTRRKAHCGLAALLAVAGLLLAACGGDGDSPSVDAPGKLLSVQNYAGPTALQEASANVSISYVTTSFNGKPTTVNGLISLPKTPPPAGGYPVISWANGTTGFAPQCAPSAVVSAVRDAYLNEWLKRGYAVLRTDYEGWGGATGHRPLVHGTSNANAVTDIVTAAHAYSSQLSNDWMVVGHSEGAGAAVWTAGLVDEAGGKYPLKGAIAIAPVGPGILKFMDNAVNGGAVLGQPFLSVTVLAAKVVDPTINLDALVKEPMKSQVEAARTQCLGPLFVLPQLQPGQYLNPGADYDKVARFLKTQQDPSALTMRVPVSIIQGSNDETTVTPPTTAQMISSLCSRGASIQYKEYAGQTHSGVIPTSQDDAFSFAAAAFAGNAPKNSCM